MSGTSVAHKDPFPLPVLLGTAPPADGEGGWGRGGPPAPACCSAPQEAPPLGRPARSNAGGQIPSSLAPHTLGIRPQLARFHSYRPSLWPQTCQAGTCPRAFALAALPRPEHSDLALHMADIAQSLSSHTTKSPLRRWPCQVPLSSSLLSCFPCTGVLCPAPRRLWFPRGREKPGASGRREGG